ncbi:HtaA domain-containing protein [Streptomyces sp. NPDC090022]|uniref:HtaA domain-containing protein n=1 Tax=Streptomyces sp. NPDC090022 TaxID=3365920 RepID=UPI0038139FC7
MSFHRRSLALAAATLTAAALGASALMLPASAAEPAGAAKAGQAGQAAPAAGAPTAPRKVIGGTLDWGLLKDYREYVTGMAHGTITVGDGAKQNADGTFRFGAPAGQYDPRENRHTITAAFQGSVTFSSPAPPAGHGFTVKLSDFRIDSGTRKLTADVTKGEATTQDVPLADVAFKGMDMTGLATKLTKEAADQLGSQRYNGLAGDPLTAKLQFEDQAPGPTTTPSNTSSPSSTPSATASATATQAPDDDVQKILSGRLTWGFKESFRGYVLGAGGSVTPAGGAAKNGSTFDFALGKGELEAKAKKLDAAFAGSLRFQYAAHGIDITLANPRVKAAGASGTLYLDVTNAAGAKTAVPFATLDLSRTDYRTAKGVLALDSVPAVFTAEGAATFDSSQGNMYKAGMPMDALVLSVAVDKDAVLPSATPTSTATATTPAGGTAGGGGSVGGGTAGGGSAGGNLAATGSEVPAGTLLLASGTIVAAGAGAVFLARRRRTTTSG